MADNNTTIHFRDYKSYLDKVQHITLTGSENAWFEIKADFLYDNLMGVVKDSYKDSFNRVMNVEVLN